MKTFRKTSLIAAGSAIGLSLLFAAQPAMAKSQDTVKYGKWEVLSKGYMGRPKEVDNEILQANLAGSSPTAEAEYTGPVYSLWLETTDQGAYSVSVSELASGLGVSPSEIEKRAIQQKLLLTNEGKDVAWHYDEEGDAIVFTADAYETFYTDKNAFQFAFSSKPKTIISATGNKSPELSENSYVRPFTDELHFEVEESVYWLNTWAVSAADDNDVDYWPWRVMVPQLNSWESFTAVLNIPDMATDDLHIRINLRGRSDTDGNSGLYPVNLDDHHITAYLDYTSESGSHTVLIGDAQWDGMDIAFIDQHVSLPGGPSVSGIYTLRLEADSTEGYPDGLLTFTLLNEVDVVYSRLPVARARVEGEEGDLLWLHDVKEGTQTVTNFSTEKLVVIENPGPEAKFVTGTRIECDEAEACRVTFNTVDNKDYLVYDAASVRTANVTRDIPSDLTSRSNRAEYLIIASRAFPVTAKHLSELRLGNPYSSVKIAWIDDIYEIFGYGRVDPFAISRFVDYAVRNWKIGPTTVAIIGNGNFDHKNRLERGDSFIPTVMINTVYDRGDGPQTEGLFVSDFRLINGSGDLGIAVGRIPILNDAEGANYVAKIAAYESFTPAAYRTATLLADEADPSAGNFPLNMANLAANELVDHLGFYDFESGKSGVEVIAYPDLTKDKFKHPDTWNVDLVMYDGHGSQAGLSNRNLFDPASIVSLNAANAALVDGDTNIFFDDVKMPIFSALSCSVGNFARPGVIDLATLLMLPDVEPGTGEFDPGGHFIPPVLKPGGVIGSMVPTALSYDIDAQILGSYFVNSLYGPELKMILILSMTLSHLFTPWSVIQVFVRYINRRLV
jgi:hypothetical protein